MRENDIQARLLAPDDCVFTFIDHQPQMAFAVQSHDRTLILNSVVGLARAARVFGVPAVLTTVASETFSGPIFPELAEVFPGVKPIERTTMNAWEHPEYAAAIRGSGRKKIVMAGLWTEVCVVMPALCAIEEGFAVYVVTDACGGITTEAHEMSVQRMVQAGAVPVTWLQVMLELQRDWARTGTYAAVGEVVLRHGGAYGMGSRYAQAMIPHAGEGGAGSPQAAEDAGRREILAR